MEVRFALSSVYLTSSIGLCLMFVLIASNTWRLRDRSPEGISILSMWSLTILACILDPIAYTIDGAPGSAARVVNYVSNSMIYLVNMLNAFAWFAFLVAHMQFRLKFVHKAILGGFLSLGVFVQIFNLFVPVVFAIDESNTYVRLLGYYLYVFIDHGFIIDSLILYLISRKRGGLLKLFPVWVYAIPFVLGTVVQSNFFGISVLCASYAVSIAGVMACLQRNMVYRDEGTGIYNKAYLDFISKQYVREKNKKVAVILLNINGFRKINETFGRDVGDEVLARLSRILSQTVGETGNVVHYSADEFIILQNAPSGMVSSVNVNRIKSAVENFNKQREFPCEISVRMEVFDMDLGTTTINSRLNEMNLELSDRR